MSRIELKHIDKFYGSNHVLRDINLTIEDGDFMTLLGPSGCGKTTTLRVVSGLEKPQNGIMTIDGVEMINADDAYYAEPSKRGLNLVFQSYALWPHMTVYDNIAFGLKIQKMDKAEIERRVMDSLKMMRIDMYKDRYPTELSGGQQQRVAIARSLVNQPRVLLLDEPLGALDLKLRKEMQLELKRLQREMNITFVYVTHDQEEALTMSDTVVVMNKGNIQQIGSPQDIYNEPCNAFVANFIGDSNIVDGIMEKDFLVSFAGREFTCVDRGFKMREPVQVVIRPEDVAIVPPSVGMLTGLVREVIFKGVHFEMHVDVEGKEWLIHSTQASQPGELIGMNIGPDEIHIMSREEV